MAYSYFLVNITEPDLTLVPKVYRKWGKINYRIKLLETNSLVLPV